MTKKEVFKQVYNLAINGIFDDRKYSLKAFSDELTAAFKLTGTNEYYMTIAMPDGKWYMKIYKVKKHHGMWDYYIPDDRAAEEKLIRSSILESMI